MKKELLTLEFRFYRQVSGGRTYFSKEYLVDMFDNLLDAVIEGNKLLDKLSNSFEIRAHDRFEVFGLFNAPKRLVTNTCYPTDGIQYFAKIEKLEVLNIKNFLSIDEIKRELEK